MKAIKKIMSIAVATMLIVSTLGIAAFAEDTVPDLPGGPYQLTVAVQSTGEGGETSGISGAQVSIYKVASLNVENGAAAYTPVEEFDCGIDYTGMEASASNEAAKTLADAVAENSISGQSGVCDDSGNADFTDLEPGIYLVKLDSYSEDNSGYSAMEPFLAMVPGIAEGEDGANIWVADVAATPKTAINKEGIVTSDPPITKVVEGTPSEDSTFEFVLEAEDIQNPMPVGSADGKITATIEGSGEAEFGIMTYTEPGEYKYKASEVNTGVSGYTYDTTIYYITVNVERAGSSLTQETIIETEDGAKSDTCHFVNKYESSPIEELINNPPDIPGKNVKTGDETMMLLLLGLMILSFLGYVVVRRMKKNIE